jgi:adenine-specific DNA-methyltransferase
MGGTQLLSAFLGERDLFTFPKSVYAVRDCIEVAIGDRPHALVLDFFAGSGTTLHATALLNAEDGGRRQCILVTNNEVDEEQSIALNREGFFRGDERFEAAGIFEAVTRPRVRAALTGKRPDGTPVPGEYLGGRAHAEGFRENVAFFRLDYADADAVELGQSLQAILPVLWLVSGSRGDPSTIVADNEVMLLPEQSPFAVLLDEDRLKDFVAALCSRPDVTHVWLVTDSERAFARMREQVPGDRFVGMLYRDYLRNFRINAAVAQ